jgi:hypothetical protein
VVERLAEVDEDEGFVVAVAEVPEQVEGAETV